MRTSLPTLILASLLASVLLFGCVRDWRVGDRKPPNILLIVVDTLRADHLGCYGYERSTSPNIDILADMSTVFDRAYSHSPWTMPSVASIVTGLEPREHGITKWEDSLGLQLVTLAEVLQDQGYRTGASVSHYILEPDYHFDQGFEVYDVGPVDKVNPHTVITSGNVTDKGIVLTRPHRPEPWFVMLHYFDPHAWYQPHPDFDFGTEDMDLYDGEIAFTDLHIGRLLDKMAQRDQLRDTIVVLVADHGEAFMDHGHNQHTISLYEELIRVPLIVWVPGFEPSRRDQVVAETQLAPTLLTLAGLPVPPSMRAPPIPFERDGFLPHEDYRIYAETRRSADKRAVVDGDWKLIHDRRRRRLELYDLAEDPTENDNRRGREKGRTKELKALLVEHEALPRATVEPMVLSAETQQALESLGYLTDDGDQVQQEDAEIPVGELHGPALEPEG